MVSTLAARGDEQEINLCITNIALSSFSVHDPEMTSWLAAPTEP